MVAKLGWPMTTTPEQRLRCEQEPPAQKVDFGTPKHLTLEHLQAAEVAFHCVTPGP